MGYFTADGQKSIGVFQEKGCGNWFEFRQTDDEWALKQGLRHEIALMNGEWRYADVKKTVAYVAVDEDEFGAAVLEKWSIKRKNND